ncbi:MAG TPA: helix-turn-helix domain-containing protein [Blastocatellia bacterium]|nr:helix-turn-helix domain-containing protein [Blastocatellia bacterium]
MNFVKGDRHVNEEPEEHAGALGLSYSTICRWLRQFREAGLPGLFPATEYPREPQTPELVIVTLLYYKCCVPRASDRELARVLSATTDHRIHHETVKALLERYPIWRYSDFQCLIQYQVPSDQQKLRQEMVKLRQQGWTEKRIAQLLRCSRNTVMKWLRRARQAESQPNNQQSWLLDLSHAPQRPARKVFFGAIHAVLELQKKYGYAGWFRIEGYLEADPYNIKLGETTIKRIMALNRRIHLAPQRPAVVVEVRDPREGPPKSSHPFEHTFIDRKYLDAKPAGVQLYSTLLLEGLSRTIIAGSLTTQQEVGVILHIYFQALRRWGLWKQVISDHGGQFISHDFKRVNKRLGIQHEMYEKGKPWRNLIESQFGIQARLGEYHWEKCKTIEEAVEFHRELIRDHNRLPHWAHHRRNDGKHSPLAVLGEARGQWIEPVDLQRAFGQRYSQRMTDARGFVKIGRGKIYVEEGLPRTRIQLSFWDGRLRAEYQSQVLMEYQCKCGKKSARPTAISQSLHYAHPFQSRQMALFDPLWVRDPLDLATQNLSRSEKKQSTAQQLRLYLGPELVETA